MKNKWRNVIVVLLVLTGIGTIAYPRYQVYHMKQEQEAMMKEWEKALSYIDKTPTMNELSKEKNEIYRDLSKDEGIQRESREEDILNEEEATNALEIHQEKKIELTQDMEGIIDIQSIDLQLPILKGITKGNLNRSLAGMENGFYPGSGMNFVIAGHRSHQEGQLFNRLDEVQMDDIISIDFGTVQESFVITDKIYVEPDDLSVLDNIYEEDELTLITCHPMIHPTHRLIVKAKLQ